MFCVKCGKEARVEHFCEEHFLERQNLFDIKDFTLIYCDLCGIKQDEIKETIRSRIKSEHNMDEASIALKIVGNKVHAKIECEGEIEGLTKRQEKKALVILRKKMCDAHVKLSGGYYEAMIQARGDDRIKILHKVQRLVPQKAIADIIELKEGYNIKIVRKANAAAVAKELRKHHKIIQSYKLVGSKKGQKLYRNYYALR
jgi:nonsense-mediated mRNA decay protein 3